MKRNVSSTEAPPENKKVGLRQLPRNLVELIRWLVTHPIACLVILVVPIGLYLCALSTMQLANRGDIRATATAHNATAAAAQTSTAFVLQTPTGPAAIPAILTPVP